MEKHERTKAGLGSLGGLGLFAGVSLLASALGASAARPRNKVWYRLLRKSSATPRDSVFGLVWPILYGLGALSAWRVARRAPSRHRTEALAWWSVQLATNAAWTPLFFGAHRSRLAMIDLMAHYAALGRYAWAARSVDRPAAVMVVPQLAWLAFAATLNASIIVKNPKWLSA